MKVGLFFGSFNPVHLGHLLVATLIREKAGVDEVWFIVSPLNPFKINGELADEQHRLEMVRLAVGDSPVLRVSDIEFTLEKPSYTHITLKELRTLYPQHTFQLVIGEDNVEKFSEWREAEWISANFTIIVYKRGIQSSTITENTSLHSFKFYEVPLLEISSTNIRLRIQNNLPIRYFVTSLVEQYIKFHKVYPSK